MRMNQYNSQNQTNQRSTNVNYQQQSQSQQQNNNNNNNDQPKTIEDYKDVVKILKLKIIKQNHKIQQLQAKNRQYQEEFNNVTIGGNMTLLNNTNTNNQSPFFTKDKDLNQLNAINITNNISKQDFDTSNLKGKAAVMYLFQQGCKKFGITPQSIFRIADFSYKNQVQSDYFRTVLSKINLSLTPKQISCLIFIFDQSCSGFISREDYIYSLHAYQISMEDSSLPYNQECLLKVAALLSNDKIDLNKFYEEMQNYAKKQGNPQDSNSKINKPKIDANVFEYQMKKSYPKKIKQRQIIGSFNEIDLQSQGFIDKTNFLYCVTSFINRLLYGSQAQEMNKNDMENSNMNTGNIGNMSPSKTNKNNSSSGMNEQNLLNIGRQYNNSHINIAIPDKSNVNKQNLNNHAKQPVLALLQNEHNLKLPKIYQQLLEIPFTKRLTLQKFKSSLLKINSTLPSQLIVLLFKQIDYNQKGSIYINQLINYFLINSNDSDIIFRLLGKYFFNNDLTAQKFMFMHGLQSDSDITKNKFLQIMNKMFTNGFKKSKNQQGSGQSQASSLIQTGQQWNNIWNIFDRNNRGVANVGNIIKIWEKYQLS